MASSRKKAILRRWNEGWMSGYLPLAGFVHGEAVEMLDLAGKVLSIPVEEVKWVCFVRDFSSGDLHHPERLLRKSFAGRPRGSGLWVRARLKDKDLIEGLAKNDASLLDGHGLFLTPPDTRSNTQTIFLPRQAVAELSVLAVVGAARAQRGLPAEPQPTLFPEPGPKI